MKGDVAMKVKELDRWATHSGEVVAQFEAEKQLVQLVGTFANRATLNDLLYTIACRRISEGLRKKRDNIVLIRGDGKL